VSELVPKWTLRRRSAGGSGGFLSFRLGRTPAQQAIDGGQELRACERLLERQIGAENDD
jgi:hypothetical protein